MWVACSQPDSFRQAGELGLGVLCFNLGGYAQMEERVAAYKEAVKNANPVGSFVNNQVAALCIVHCAEDDEEARRVGAPEGAWFVQQAENLYAPWAGPEGARLLQVLRGCHPNGAGGQDGRRPLGLRSLCDGQPGHHHRGYEEVPSGGRGPRCCALCSPAGWNTPASWTPSS